MPFAPVILQLVAAGCGVGLAASVAAPTGRSDALPLCRPWTASSCFVDVAASLRGARSGAPLVGKLVKFVCGETVICESATDATGRASCRGVAPSGRVIAASGYQIVFEGDRRFDGGSAAVSMRRPSGP